MVSFLSRGYVVFYTLRTFCMRRSRTFLKIWTKSMKRSREWAMKSLSPFLAFLMITWVSNMMKPQKMARPMYK